MQVHEYTNTYGLKIVIYSEANFTITKGDQSSSAIWTIVSQLNVRKVHKTHKWERA